ncbi:MAG TPA: hypothetical protein VE988_15975, partial [Gemmataceae bacterium]|nr:hypothetical protein [Gemmataceae bacterium]
YDRTGYVAVTRGREQVQIFTNDRKELMHALTRPDEPMSATELSHLVPQKPSLHMRLKKSLRYARGGGAAGGRSSMPQEIAHDSALERSGDHDR